MSSSSSMVSERHLIVNDDEICKTAISDKTKNLLAFRDKILEKDEQNLALISVERMHPDFFAGTFFSLMTKYKDMYNVSNENQADYFFEALLVMAIQMIICTCVWLVHTDRTDIKDEKPEYTNKFLLNLC